MPESYCKLHCLPVRNVGFSSRPYSDSTETLLDKPSTLEDDATSTALYPEPMTSPSPLFPPRANQHPRSPPANLRPSHPLMHERDFVLDTPQVPFLWVHNRAPEFEVTTLSLMSQAAESRRPSSCLET
ncbi:predicted protein [Coccidioides posadasii str. Silveira]|uniref:Predicted protein n=2 Tax=Coccidioides posadasii TaxID=199306 RepID=E9CXV6_COCPS|nr:predicted protein [Coccidioides posadasii str. Silveira]KMM72659.1 hypothetical protein CPAG_08953 [Coccidioides posadasii RMSCC 3488]